MSKKRIKIDGRPIRYALILEETRYFFLERRISLKDKSYEKWCVCLNSNKLLLSKSKNMFVNSNNIANIADTRFDTQDEALLAFEKYLQGENL